MKPFRFFSIVVCLCGVSMILYGQTTKAPKDSTKKLIGAVGPSVAAATGATNTSYAPDVTPPSPNAASLGKYGDIPVSNYTGLPNTSIPLYTLSYRDLSVPISLSYHHSGVKVEEDASWVGLGWSLNAGGAITRTIRGRDDLNTTYGIPFNPLVIPPNTPTPENDANFINKIVDGFSPSIDTEPDLFYYNIGGQSGKFILASGTVFPLKGILLDKSDVDITCNRIATNPNRYSWTIITANGNRYVFEQQEITASLSSGENPVDFAYKIGRDDYKVTAWYITTITAANTNTRITFNYDNINRYYSASRISTNEVWSNSGVVNTGVGVVCQTPLALAPKNPGQSYSVQITKNVYLTSIVSDNASVEFTWGDREDIQQYFKTVVENPNMPFSGRMPASGIEDVTAAVTGTYKKPQRLMSFLVKDKSNNHIKSFIFQYSYFNAAQAGTLSASPTTAEYTQYYDLLRLRLDKVQELDNAEANRLPPYKFVYTGDIADANGNVTTPVTLPTKVSWAKDYWGFYNGKIANNTLQGQRTIPKLAFPKMTANKNGSGNYFSLVGVGNTFDVGIDREVDTTAKKTGVLAQIFYPTGGYTKFEYGSHKAFGGAGDVDYMIYETSNPSQPVSFVNTLSTNIYADIIYTLSCSKYCSDANCTSPVGTCVVPSNFQSTWYGRVTKDGTTFSERLYGSFNGGACTNNGGGYYTCVGTDQTLSLALPSGAYTIAVNMPATNMPTPSLKMIVYTYRDVDYKYIDLAGLRISRIIDHTPDKVAKIKSYSYVQTTGESSGKQMRKPFKYQTGTLRMLQILEAAYGPFNPSCQDKSWGVELNSFSYAPLGTSAGGNHVGYSRVVVNEVNPVGNTTNGTSVYEYLNVPEVQSPNINIYYASNPSQNVLTENLFPDIPTKENLSNGMLTRESHYTTGQKLIKETLYTPTAKTTISSTYYGMKFLYGQAIPGNVGTVPFSKSYYEIPSEFWFNASVTDRVYNTTDNNYIETITQNAYDSPNHIMITSTVTTESKTHSDGTARKRKTVYQYPPDLKVTGNVFDGMFTQHIYTPAVTEQILQETESGATKVFNQVAFKETTFKKWYDTRSYTVLGTALSYLPCYAPEIIRTQQTTADPLSVQVTFTAYDEFGNPTAFTERNGVSTQLAWNNFKLSTTNVYIDEPVSVGKYGLIKSKTIAPTNALLQTSLYDYYPSVGLKTVTDPNGLIMNYIYDNFSRLKEIRDYKNNLVKTFSYNYANDVNGNPAANNVAICATNLSATVIPESLVDNGQPVVKLTGSYDGTTGGSDTFSWEKLGNPTPISCNQTLIVKNDNYGDFIFKVTRAGITSCVQMNISNTLGVTLTEVVR